MNNNNPMQQMLQMLSMSNNPNQVVQMLAQQNPNVQAILNQMQQSGMTPQQFAMQYARQNNIDINQVANAFRKMGVSFDKYDEEEFYTIYLMHISDYPEIANDYYTYVAMAKKWLEDDDIEVSPSEKVCIYMYDIVMGEED
jgi:hypothetical protein